MNLFIEGVKQAQPKEGDLTARINGSKNLITYDGFSKKVFAFSGIPFFTPFLPLQAFSLSPPSNSYSYDNRDLLGQVPPNQTYLEKKKKNVSPFFCIFKLEWQQSDKHCLNHYMYTQLPQNALSLSFFPDYFFAFYTHSLFGKAG